MIPDCDGRTVGQTESIIANTALCIAMLTRCKKAEELLERIQHRFTRMVPGLKQLTYDQRLEALNLWTLEERRIRADLIEV